MREVVETAAGGAKVAVTPVAVSVMSVAGIELSNWVYIGTIVYLCVQIGYVLHKWRKGI